MDQRFHHGDWFDGGRLASKSDILRSNSYVDIGVTASGMKVIITQVLTERKKQYNHFKFYIQPWPSPPWYPNWYYLIDNLMHMKINMMRKIWMNNMKPNRMSLKKIISGTKTYYKDYFIMPLDILSLNCMYAHHFQIKVIGFILVYLKIW